MTQGMSKFRPVGRKHRSTIKMGVWLLVGLAAALLLWRTGDVALAGLFQSDLTPTVVPPTLPQTVVVTVETPTVLPTAVPSPTETPVPPTQVVETPTLLPTATQSVPRPTSAAVSGGGLIEEKRESATSGSRSFLANLGLVLAYIWLVCGVVVLLAVIALFVFLWRAGRRRREGTGQDQGGE